MAISKDKKRYNITMRPGIVTRFKTLAQQCGISPWAMSAICEEALSTFSDILQTAKNKGSLNLSDIHHLIGKQMELIEREEKEGEQSASNEKVVSNVYSSGRKKKSAVKKKAT